MTSEVVVMNRLGIALASDSASTVHIGGGRTKFYHADKLFMLSNHQPVGIMVFANSSLMGVPWETIIKLFRAQLGHTKLDRLSDYADELIKFLHHCTADLFPLEVQERYYFSMLETYFASVVDTIQKHGYEIVEQVRTNNKSDSGIRALEAEIIEEALETWRKEKDVPTDQCTREIAVQMETARSGEVNKLLADHFSHADNKVMENLREIVRLIVCKKYILPESLSGIVIAGFGEKEHFPSYQEYYIGKMYRGKLKYHLQSQAAISSDVPAIIVPFAQSEMSFTFLNGIGPVYQYRIYDEVSALIEKVPNAIFDDLKIRGKAKKQALKNAMETHCKAHVRELFERVKTFQGDYYRTPIMQSIEYLPKNELAHVAQSLVNLNSLQKRISITEDETVGGPIDVAVISKGDGFVWIDRKHYFKPELNRHFFRNRMEEGSSNLNGERNEHSLQAAKQTEKALREVVGGKTTRGTRQKG